MKAFDEEQSTAISKSCAANPIARAIHLLGDVWILLIVVNLLQGPKRFNALRASLGHISSKTLSHRLKVLEELGFVQREAFLEIPPRVEYHLTEQGQEMGDVIAVIEQFGKKHLSSAPPSGCNASCAETEQVSQSNGSSGD